MDRQAKIYSVLRSFGMNFRSTFQFLVLMGIGLGLTQAVVLARANAAAFPQADDKVDKILSQQVIQNYRNGNLLELEKSLKRLANEIELHQIGAINQKLEQSHVISLGQLFLMVRAPKVAYSRNSAAPASSPVEFQMVLAAFGEACTKQMREIQDEFVGFRQQPGSYQAFDQRLAELTQLRSRLLNLEMAVQYWGRVRKIGLTDYRKILGELPRDHEFSKVVSRDPESLLQAVTKSKTEVIEQELRTRISRLETAAEDLERGDATDQDRIEAAMVVAVDGQMVPRLIKDYRPFLNHADLKDPELEKEIKSMVSDVKERHERLIEIGGRLNVGVDFLVARSLRLCLGFWRLVEIAFYLKRRCSAG